MQSRESLTRLEGVACVSFTLLGWASVPLFLRYFAEYIDAWTANGWRYGLSALFWLPVILVGWRRRTLPTGLWRAAIVPSVVNVIGQTLFAWTPYFIKPGLQTFLLRTQILFVAFGAFMLFPSERGVMRRPAFWGGLLIVMAGSVGVALLRTEPIGGATAIGIILGLSSGLFFAAYALSVRYFMTGVPSVVAFAAISQYTAFGLVVVMLALGKGAGAEALNLRWGQFATLVLSALIGIALGHAFYYASINRLGVAVSSGIIQLQPFLTGVASYFLFAERLTGGQWTSGVVAVLGALTLLTAQQRPSPARMPQPATEAVPAAEKP